MLGFQLRKADQTSKLQLFDEAGIVILCNSMEELATDIEADSTIIKDLYDAGGVMEGFSDTAG